MEVILVMGLFVLFLAFIGPRLDWSLVRSILFGSQPPVRVREGWDDLYPAGATMGTSWEGRQGSGKTTAPDFGGLWRIF